MEDFFRHVVTVCMNFTCNFLSFHCREFHQLCNDNSHHSVHCDRCMDPGTLLSTVDALNVLERVGKIQSLQRYMIAVQKVLNSHNRICGSYGAGECSFVFLFNFVFFLWQAVWLFIIMHFIHNYVFFLRGFQAIEMAES